MRLAIIGVAIALLAAGCAGPRLFDDRGHARSDEFGASARWLDGLHRAEMASTHSRDSVGLAGESDAAVPVDSIDASSTLDDLLAYARANHPAVQSAHAQWLASRERIVQQRALPNPQFSYGIMVEQIDRGSGGREPVGHSFGISQMFPWFGALDQRAAVAGEAAAAAQAQRAAAQATVVRNVKQAYAEYAYASVALGIVAGHHELLGSVEEVVRIRFRAAEVTLADLLRVQQQRDQIEVQLRTQEDFIQAAASRLNAAIGRPAEALLPVAQRVPAVELQSYDESDMLAALERANPELRVLQRQIAGRREGISLAQLAFYPDIMVGVEYGLNTGRRMSRMDGGGSDTLTGMISIDLPIWRDSYQAGVREALAEFGSSLKGFTDRRNALEADLKMAMYQLRDAQRRVTLYGDVLRLRGEQTLEATLTAYRGGEATFTDLIQVQRELLEFELAHERALADSYQRFADIESLLGEVVEGTAARLSEPHSHGSESRGTGRTDQ